MYTITLNGNSSELSCDIFPPLEVDETTQLCLLSLQTNNSIPNIEPGCNTIGYKNSSGEKIYITIPTGSYELSELESVIQNVIAIDNISFQLQADTNTLKCKMINSHDIDFTDDNNISRLLGFKNRIYEAGQHESDTIVNIMKVNCIKIECNLISGSFSDGTPSQTIHEFYPSVPPGYKIIEVPRHPVFYSLNTTSISKVDIVLKDQDGSLINLREQPITIRLQIKRNHGS
jgi:hypothetical protein